MALTDSKTDTKESPNLISINSSKVGNAGDDFSFLNSFFGINSSSSNTNSTSNLGMAIPSSDTKNNFDFDFTTSQTTNSNDVGDFLGNNKINNSNNFTGFKKTSLVSDIVNPESNIIPKSNISLFDGMTHPKNTNDNILDSLGLSQMGNTNDNTSKPVINTANRNSSNNFDAFNFNMNNSNVLTNKSISSNSNGIRKPMPSQELTNKNNFIKQNDSSNKANMLDSLLNEIAPSKTDTKPAAFNKTTLNDWNFNMTESNLNQSNTYMASGNNYNNMNNYNLNKDSIGFKYEYNNNNAGQINPQIKHASNGYDFNFNMGSNSSQGKVNSGDEFNLGFNNSSSMNSFNMNKIAGASNVPNNDPFSGLNLTPNSSNNKNDPNKNLLDGLLRF